MTGLIDAAQFESLDNLQREEYIRAQARLAVNKAGGKAEYLPGQNRCRVCGEPYRGGSHPPVGEMVMKSERVAIAKDWAARDAAHGGGKLDLAGAHQALRGAGFKKTGSRGTTLAPEDIVHTYKHGASGVKAKVFDSGGHTHAFIEHPPKGGRQPLIRISSDQKNTARHLHRAAVESTKPGAFERAMKSYP